ncbi:hypothetical protein HYC85_028968 [Camellia sinensis]|uniref:Uncharacterized protein n=1 Tax=Camellia sinensis TaxID=4442 RepID=A0A7J7FXC7_CAMSI|nr:hypothetical protein HYC85_028968 [Camellia sinensis]
MHSKSPRQRSARMPNPRREERRKYYRRTTEFLSATLGANLAPRWMDSDIISKQQPFFWIQMALRSQNHLTWTKLHFSP